MLTTAAERAILTIREAMTRKGLVQEDLAGFLKCSQSKIAKLLNGRMDLTVNELDRLCFGVGISLVESVRDRGLEFCAEMTPTELRLLESIRQMDPQLRDLLLYFAGIKKATSPERYATDPNKAVRRGRK